MVTEVIFDMNAKEIEKRFKNEVYWCQLTYQYLDELYQPEKRYKLEPAGVFFDRLYIILVDYLCMRIIRLFDPAEDKQGNKNFTLERIAETISGIRYSQTCSKKHVKKVKYYRNKYLAHADLNTTPADLPAYRDLKESLRYLLDDLQDNLDVIKRFNGDDSCRQRYIPSESYSDFDQLISWGAFLHSKGSNPESRDRNRELIFESVQWNRKMRGG